MEISNLISLKPYRNYKAAIYASFVLAMYFYIYITMIEHSFDRKSIQDFNNIDMFQILLILLWIFVMFSIYWAYKIALQTGRRPETWILLGFLIGPVGLVIISLKDYKIRNTELLDIIKRTRLEYKREKKNVAKEITPESLNELEQKYEQLLSERSAEIITKEKVEVLKELIGNGVINSDIDIKEKEKIIKIIEFNKIMDSDLESWNPNWTDNDAICPACGTQRNKNANNCLNCGLRLE